MTIERSNGDTARQDGCAEQLPVLPAHVPRVGALPPTSSMPIVVRAATAPDLPAVIDLLARAELPVGDVGPELIDGMCVASSGAELIGSAAIEHVASSGLLRSVAVDDGWRCTGLGARLVGDRVRWAASRRIETLYLLTTTAASFFERLGFSRLARADLPLEIRETREFSTICPASAVALTCRVPALETREEDP